MELSGSFFPFSWLTVFGALLAFALWKALIWTNWSALSEGQRLHAFLGSTVALLLLWALRIEVEPGLHWHFSGMVALTLMFGWSLALIGGHLALFGVTLAGFNDWAGYLPSAVVQVLLPATLTQITLALVRAYLPKHYFVYVFINAFLVGGVAATLSALVTAGMLLATGAFGAGQLRDGYLSFLPLMFFPEAVLNGWVIAILVNYRPQWVRTFRDEEYLNDK